VVRVKLKRTLPMATNLVLFNPLTASPLAVDAPQVANASSQCPQCNGKHRSDAVHDKSNARHDGT